MADGKPQLKPDAIPTIFCHRPPPKARRPPLKRSFPETTDEATHSHAINNDHDYCQLSAIDSNVADDYDPNTSGIL